MAAAARVGRVIDIAWAPLPAPAGGAVLLAATDDGGVAVLDACQAADAGPRRLRYLFAGGLACQSPSSIVPGNHVLGSAQLLEGRCFTAAVCRFAVRHMITVKGYSSHGHTPGYLA